MPLLERMKSHRHWSLRLTVLLAVGLGFLLLALVQYRIAARFVTQFVQERETQDAFERLDGLQRAVALMNEDLQSSAADWANWNDTYRYVQDRNAQYIADNIDAPTMTRLRLNLFAVFDEQGRLAYAVSQPGPHEALRPAPADVIQRLASDPALSPRGTVVNGLVHSARGAFLISSHPVRDSQAALPPRGRLIMGRSLGMAIPQVARVTSMRIDLLPAGIDAALSGADVQRLRGHTVYAASPSKLEGYTQLRDVSDRTVAVLHAVINRPLQNAVTEARPWLMLISGCIAFVCCVLSVLFIERRVVRPVAGLARQLQAVANAPGTLKRVEAVDTAAELTVLSSSINDMLSKVEAQQRLRQQHDAAVQASHMKSEFLATMSHEVRTPMNGVLGMCELLLRTHLDPRQRRLAETILNSGRSLLNILNEVLDYSKIEAGKVELAHAEFAVADVVEGVTATFGAEALKKNVLLSTDIAPEVPARALGDPHRLRQVLLNLVSNAIKFTASGSVRIVCSLETVSRDTVCLRFEVSDTGVGIAAEAQARIFEPFVQVHQARGAGTGGSGLGLAIAQRLVGAMRGHIGVRSEPGHGATFSFTVELGRCDSQPLAAPPLADPAAAAFDARSALRVLLVEDNEVNREVVIGMLQQVNCSVTTAENGAHGVDACRSGCYDAVIMDCEMPVMDGHTAARRIRQLERSLGRPPVPIVALTANVTPENRQRCFESGMTVFLTKPVSQARLEQALTQALQGEPARALQG